jgi:hypothetical protein
MPFPEAVFSPRERSGLQYGVRALAHAYLNGQVYGVYYIKVDIVFGYIALGFGGQVVAELFLGPLAVMRNTPPA